MSDELTVTKLQSTRRDFLKQGGYLALSLTAIGGLIGCADGRNGLLTENGEPATNGDADDPTPSVVTYVTPFGMLVGYAPVLVADSAGIFEANGIALDLEPGGGSAQAVQQVIGGQSLLSRSGGLDLISAVANEDAPIKSVGTIAQQNTFAVISDASDPVASPEDMNGETIGVVSVGGGTETILDMMLTVGGYEPGNTVREAVGNAPGAFALIGEGRIKAFIASVDTVAALEVEGADIHSILTDEIAPVPGQVYFSTQEEVDSGSEIIQAFMDSIREAVDEILGDRENDFETTLEHLSNYEIEALNNIEAARAGLAAQVQLWVANGEDNVLLHDIDAWSQAQQLMADAGAISTPVDVDRLVTNQYVG